MDEDVLMATSAARKVPKRATIERQRVSADSFDRAVWLALLLLIGVIILLVGGIAALAAVLR